MTEGHGRHGRLPVPAFALADALAEDPRRQERCRRQIKTKPVHAQPMAASNHRTPTRAKGTANSSSVRRQ